MICFGRQQCGHFIEGAIDHFLFKKKSSVHCYIRCGDVLAEKIHCIILIKNIHYSLYFKGGFAYIICGHLCCTS